MQVGEGVREEYETSADKEAQSSTRSSNKVPNFRIFALKSERGNVVDGLRIGALNRTGRCRR